MAENRGSLLLAIISDTHLPRGRRRIPDACLARLESADAILHAGDFTSEQALREITAIGPPLHAVHGNIDELSVRRALPEARTVELSGARIALLHDAGPARGRLERMRARFPEADALVFGHSHIPVHEEREGFQLLNPGSPTDRRRQPHHTMALGRVHGGRVEFELVRLD